MIIQRRDLIQSLSCAWIVLPQKQLVAAALGTRSNAVTHNVRDFGAVGDGVADDTAAFNRATSASAAWSTALEFAVFVPAGRYRISGTVYVRKGQTLYGEGLSSHIDASNATQSTFVLGRSLFGGKAVDDPGGSPVKISNLRGLGGAASHGFIYTCAQGFQITGLFLSATGLGIEIEAADGIMSDIAIDMCLNGIVLRNCQNIVANNINIYLPNYAISFMGECRDIVFSNTIVTYTKYASVLFGESVQNIDNVMFSNCIFVNNVQYHTFSGYVHTRASHVSAVFRSCSFRNWPRYAVNYGGGVDVSLSFNDCVFDGAPTNPVYNKSWSARCVNTGEGRYRLTNCEFRNLHGEIATVNENLGELVIIGGSISDCPAERMLFTSQVTGRISVRDVDGFASVKRNHNLNSIALPWWGQRTIWRIQLVAENLTVRELIVAVSKTGKTAVPAINTIMNWSVDPTKDSDSKPVVNISRNGPASGQIVIDVVAGAPKTSLLAVDVETVG